MSGGGGSAPAQTTSITRTEPPEYVKPYSVELMNRAGALADAPYQQYGGQRIADFTDQHYAGLQGITDAAMAGNPAVNAAEQGAVGTLQGQMFGPGLGSNVQSLYNPMLGMNNPYMQSAIDQAQKGVVNQYRDVTSPQLAAAERASGSFGNSGLQQMQLKAMSDLSSNLGDIENQFRMQDYGLQAQLGESAIGRDLQSQQFNVGAQQSAWGDERENQMRAMALAPQFQQAYYSDMQKLLGAGDIMRDFNQNQLNLAESDWQAQAQWPYQQLDVLANAIRTSMGAGGSSIASSPSAYQPSSTANMIGGGLLGYGAGSQFGSPYGALGAGAGAALGLWG